MSWRTFTGLSPFGSRFPQPSRRVVEEEQAHVLAPVEHFAEAVLGRQQHVREVHRDLGHEAEAALWGVGDRRDRIDGGHLDGKVHAADAGQLGGEHQEIRCLCQRRQRPREDHREREPLGRIGIGVVLLVCIIVYLIPRTAIFGAILLTGYLGGAIATQVRVDSPLFSHVLFPIYVALLVWGGVFLRCPRLRALIPVQRSEP